MKMMKMILVFLFSVAAASAQYQPQTQTTKVRHRLFGFIPMLTTSTAKVTCAPQTDFGGRIFKCSVETGMPGSTVTFTAFAGKPKTSSNGKVTIIPLQTRIRLNSGASSLNWVGWDVAKISVQGTSIWVSPNAN